MRRHCQARDDGVRPIAHLLAIAGTVRARDESSIVYCLVCDVSHGWDHCRTKTAAAKISLKSKWTCGGCTIPVLVWRSTMVNLCNLHVSRPLR